MKNLKYILILAIALFLYDSNDAYAFESHKIETWIPSDYSNERDYDYGSSSNWFYSSYGDDYTAIDDISVIIDQGQHFILASNEYRYFDIAVSVPNWVHTYATYDAERNYRLYFYFSKSDLDAHRNDKYQTVFYVVVNGDVYIVNQSYLKNYSRIFNFIPDSSNYDGTSYFGYYQFTNKSSNGYIFSVNAGDPSQPCALRSNYSINDVEYNIINFMCPLSEVEPDSTLDRDEFDLYYDSTYQGNMIQSEFDADVPAPTNIISQSDTSFTFNPYQDIVTYADGSNIYLDISCASYVDCLDVNTYSRYVSQNVPLSVADYDNIHSIFSFLPGGINYDSNLTYEENFNNAAEHGFYNYVGVIDYHVNDNGLIGKMFPSTQSTDWTITNYYKKIYNKISYQTFTTSKSNFYVPMVHLGFKDVTQGLNSLEVFTRTINDLNDRLYQFQTLYAKQCGYSPIVTQKKRCFKLSYIVDGKRSQSLYFCKDDDLNMLCSLEDAITFGFLPSDYQEENDIVYDSSGFSQNDVNSDIAKYLLNSYVNGGSGGSASSSTGSVSAIGINGDVNNASSVGDINITVPGGSNASSGSSGSSGSSIPFTFSPDGNIWTNLTDGISSGFGLLGDAGLVNTLTLAFRWFDPYGVVKGVLITGIILLVGLGVVKFIKS